MKKTHYEILVSMLILTVSAAFSVFYYLSQKNKSLHETQAKPTIVSSDAILFDEWVDNEVEYNPSLKKNVPMVQKITHLPDTEGYVFFADIGQGVNSQLLVMYAPNDASKAEELLRITNSYKSLIFHTDEQALYYQEGAGTSTKIMRLSLTKDNAPEINIFAQAGADLLIGDGQELIDYFLTDDGILYYLVDVPHCQEYMGKCSGDLYKRLKDGTERLMARQINANVIVGTSKLGNSLLVNHPFGDAGCWSSSYMELNIADGNVISTKVLGGCEGENDDIVVRDSLEAEFYARSYVDVLSWQNGKLLPNFDKEKNLYSKINTNFNLGIWGIYVR